MKYLYYCNSTYQLINVINLHLQRKNYNFENIENYEADLLIADVFFDASNIKNRIVDEKLFNNVYLSKRTKNSGIFHSLKTLMDIIFPMIYIKKSTNIKKEDLLNKYDYIVVPKFSKITGAISQINKKAKIQLYEDGIASYARSINTISKNKVYNIMQNFFNCYNNFYDYECIYLNNPCLYIKQDKNKIRKMAVCNDYISNIIKASIVTEKVANKKIYWLSQFLYANTDDIICNSLMSYKKDVLYCPHPRYSIEREGFDKISKQHAWEIDILNIDDINNKLLITVDSTAAFSPKMLYNNEPYIIFLYKIEDSRKNDANVDELVKLFVESYDDKNKIFIPNNEEEYYRILEKFINK